MYKLLLCIPVIIKFLTVIMVILYIYACVGVELLGNETFV
jgi:hypothetical protein